MNYFQDISVNKRILLKLNIKIVFEGMDWIHMAHDRYHFKALVNTKMKVPIV
jgi:carbamoylphosphate synthase large subunit